MRDLSLVGLSEDRRYVLVRSSSGERFRLPVDESLRAALSGDRARLGQLEIQMDSALRPRDIQARIRRGESPEDVADAAKVSVDRIMAYAVPVLAEREHMCERSRAATIRRTHISGNPTLFGDAVDASLRAREIDAATVEWDSWRRTDGRWVITVRVPDDAAPAHYLFDPPGRYVVADDERASELVGDIPDESAMALASAVAEPAAPEEQPPSVTPPDPIIGDADDEIDEPGVTSLKRARARRAQAQEQLLIEGEQSGGVRETPPAETPAAPTTTEQDATEPETEPAAEAEPVDADANTADLSEAADQVRAAGEPAPVEQSTSAPKRSRRRERRRVPSWDEIMFGNKTEE